MKQLRFLFLLALVLLLAGSTALAAGVPGQQTIYAAYDDNGDVSALLDDDPATAWTRTGVPYGPDLTLELHGASVGEIWIRSGYAYTRNWYNHYDRPDVVRVTVYYRANQYTTSYDEYRYRLMDVYQTTLQSDDWNSGYQRLLLPKKYANVTKIELTIESVNTGYGSTGATISDIIVAAGSHATATPRSYATATPKPYVVYITPTPGPIVDDDEDDDDDEPLVERITPVPQITEPPLVEVITPVPVTPTPIVYPSDTGVVATLVQRIATRSGPTTGYDEPGSFFGEGDEVKVITKSWDSNNGFYWLQLEFKYSGSWYRAYAPESRVDVDLNLVAAETPEGTPLFAVEMLKDQAVYFGPGTEYKIFPASKLSEGRKVRVYNIENGWAQVRYMDYAIDKDRRGWVPLSSVSDPVE